MQIFLDSSSMKEAEKWSPVVSGATTNPTILLKDGGDIYEFAKFFDPKPVSVEACGDFESDARRFHDGIPNAVIKIPLLRPDESDNLSLISRLSREDIRINCTALFSLSQVILAAKAGAKYVSLFVGRIDDEGGDYKQMVADCVNYLDEGDTDTQLIVGSIRSVGQALDSVKARAHVLTLPPAVLEKMLMHKFSLETVRMFERDNETLKGGPSG